MLTAANNPFAPRTYGSLERISARVAIWRNIVNSTVFIGERGLAVVDTQVNQALARRLRQRLQDEFGKPILFAINTHYHWDHTNGNVVFAEVGATLIANRDTADYMVSKAPRQKSFLASRGFDLGPDPLVPTVFAETCGPLDLGGLTLHLSRGHHAETADPTLVWCPEERVLAAGDTVMTGSFPIFGQPSQREGLENDAWLSALDEVRGFDAVHVSPGHGPVAYSDELAGLERIMRWFLDKVRAHHDAGRTLSETISIMEADLPDWIRAIPEIWGTPRYAILRVWAGLADLGEPGWQHCKPTAIPEREVQAVRDLRAWRQAAESALEGGDSALAVGSARAATLAHGEDPAAWTLLAGTLIQVSRGIASVLEKGDCFDAARRALQRALALDPHYGPALLQLGQFHVMMAYRNGDDPSAGERHLAQAIDDDRLSARQRAEVAFYRGMAERTRGNEAAARQRFAQAQQADPSFMPARLAML
jgi:glyoxylase-like metal-dependent hydrolase (beta-lactamase superfamily II)